MINIMLYRVTVCCFRTPMINNITMHFELSPYLTQPEVKNFLLVYLVLTLQYL
jgi:hypothetical protein